MITNNWDTPQLIYTQYTGIVEANEVITSSLEVSGDSRLDSIHFIVSDWRYSRTPNITPHDIKQLIACLKAVSRICPLAKHASILKPDKAGNPLAAWYKLMAENLPWQIDLFHTPEQAFKWFEFASPPPSSNFTPTTQP